MGLNKLTLRSSKTYRHSSESERAAALTGGILKEHISEKSLKKRVFPLQNLRHCSVRTCVSQEGFLQPQAFGN